jgi:chromosome segregation ATPase
MHRIEELLTSGKPSGELIEMGYAPGTVYKVQRRVRQGKNSIQPTRDTLDPQFDLEFSENIIETLIDEVHQWQLEIESLKSEINRLAKVEENNRDLKKMVAVMDQERNSDKAKVETTISNLKHDLAELQGQMNGVKTENNELKAYLTSKDCGWTHGFAQWKNTPKCGYHAISPIH